MTRGPVTVLLALLALAGAPTAAAQAVTLQGEVLTGEANATQGAAALDCRSAGPSTGSYTTVGSPKILPGTFEETARFTIESGQVTEYTATFVIQSGLTTIRGTMTMQSSRSAFCLIPENPLDATSGQVDLIASYEATFETPLGTFTDRGRVSTGAGLQVHPDGRVSAASQSSFVSDVVIAPALGRVSGGGHLGNIVDEWISFGFTAKSDGTTVKAQCTVHDHSTGTRLTCLNATLLTSTATRVSFAGRARVNGEETDYRIDVEDLGEPGAAGDRFEITTDNGFSAAGVLAGGNIQIHD